MPPDEERTPRTDDEAEVTTSYQQRSLARRETRITELTDGPLREAPDDPPEREQPAS